MLQNDMPNESSSKLNKTNNKMKEQHNSSQTIKIER